MFSVRLVKADHYMSVPIPGLDVRYSEFRGFEVKKVPVIRIFGSTALGLKVCLHIHGVFPYIYVPYDNCIGKEQFIYQIASGIDKALNISLGNSNSHTQHVYKITLVSAIPFYGFHSKTHQFLKIYFYNPLMVKKASDLLQNGIVLGQVYQPHEAHVPFILQFCMDYNLHGMSFVNLASVRYRQGAIEGSDIKPAPLINVPEELLLPECILRISTCKLEVDAVAADILNRQTISGHLTSNPGLKAIWDEEKERRRNEDRHSQFTPQNSQIREVSSTASENYHLERLKKRLYDIAVLGANEDSEQLMEKCPSGERRKPYPAPTPEGEQSLEASFLMTHVKSLCDAKNIEEYSGEKACKMKHVGQEYLDENDTPVSSNTLLDCALNSSQTSVLDSQCLSLFHVLQDLVEDDSVLGSQQQVDDDNEEGSESDEDVLNQTLDSKNEDDEPLPCSSRLEEQMSCCSRSMKILSIPQLDGANDMLKEEDEQLKGNRVHLQADNQEELLCTVLNSATHNFPEDVSHSNSDNVPFHTECSPDSGCINPAEGKLNILCSNNLDSDEVESEVGTLESNSFVDESDCYFSSIYQNNGQKSLFFSESVSTSCPIDNDDVMNSNCLLMGDPWLTPQPKISVKEEFLNENFSSFEDDQSIDIDSVWVSISEKYFNDPFMANIPENDEISSHKETGKIVDLLEEKSNGQCRISSNETKRRLCTLIKSRAKAKEAISASTSGNKNENVNELITVDDDVIYGTACVNDYDISSPFGPAFKTSEYDNFLDESGHFSVYTTSQSIEDTTLNDCELGSDLRTSGPIIGNSKNGNMLDVSWSKFQGGYGSITYDNHCKKWKPKTLSTVSPTRPTVNKEKLSEGKDYGGLKHSLQNNFQNNSSPRTKRQGKKIKSLNEFEHERSGKIVIKGHRLENNYLLRNGKKNVSKKDKVKRNDIKKLSSQCKQQQSENKSIVEVNEPHIDVLQDSVNIDKRTVKERLGSLVRSSIVKKCPSRISLLEKNNCSNYNINTRSKIRQPQNSSPAFKNLSQSDFSLCNNYKSHSSRKTEQLCDRYSLVDKSFNLENKGKYSVERLDVKTCTTDLSLMSHDLQDDAFSKRNSYTNCVNLEKEDEELAKKRIGLYVRHKLGMLVESRSKFSAKGSNITVPIPVDETKKVSVKVKRNNKARLKVLEDVKVVCPDNSDKNYNDNSVVNQDKVSSEREIGNSGTLKNVVPPRKIITKDKFESERCDFNKAANNNSQDALSYFSSMKDLLKFYSIKPCYVRLQKCDSIMNKCDKKTKINKLSRRRKFKQSKQKNIAIKTTNLVVHEQIERRETGKFEVPKDCNILDKTICKIGDSGLKSAGQVESHVTDTFDIIPNNSALCKHHYVSNESYLGSTDNQLNEIEMNNPENCIAYVAKTSKLCSLQSTIIKNVPFTSMSEDQNFINETSTASIESNKLKINDKQVCTAGGEFLSFTRGTLRKRSSQVEEKIIRKKERVSYESKIASFVHPTVGIISSPDNKDTSFKNEVIQCAEESSKSRMILETEKQISFIQGDQYLNICNEGVRNEVKCNIMEDDIAGNMCVNELCSDVNLESSSTTGISQSSMSTQFSQTNVANSLTGCIEMEEKQKHLMFPLSQATKLLKNSVSTLESLSPKVHKPFKNCKLNMNLKNSSIHNYSDKTLISNSIYIGEKRTKRNPQAKKSSNLNKNVAFEIQLRSVSPINENADGGENESFVTKKTFGEESSPENKPCDTTVDCSNENVLQLECFMDNGIEMKKRKIPCDGSNSPRESHKSGSIPCVDGSNDSSDSDSSKDFVPVRDLNQKLGKKIHKETLRINLKSRQSKSSSTNDDDLRKFLSQIIRRPITKQDIRNFHPHVVVKRLKSCIPKTQTVNIYTSRLRRRKPNEICMCANNGLKEHTDVNYGKTEDVQLSKQPQMTYWYKLHGEDLTKINYQDHTQCFEEQQTEMNCEENAIESSEDINLVHINSGNVSVQNVPDSDTCEHTYHNDVQGSCNFSRVCDINSSKLDAPIVSNPSSSLKMHVEEKFKSTEELNFSKEDSMESILLLTNTSIIAKCNTFPAQLIYNSINFESHDANIVIIVPKIAPPTRQQVLQSIRELKLPRQTSLKPFFSNPTDVIDRKEVGHKDLKIQSCSLRECEFFKSMVPGLKGLKAYVNEAVQNLWDQSLGNSIETIFNEAHLKVALAGQAETILTPCMCAPSVNEVKLWASTRMLYKELMVTHKNQMLEAFAKPINCSESDQTVVFETLSPNSQELSEDSSVSTFHAQSSLEHIKYQPLKKEVPAFESGVKANTNIDLEGQIKQMNDCDPIEKLLAQTQFRQQLVSPEVGDGSKSHDSIGFKMSYENLQDCRAVIEPQCLTLLAIEIHIQTRGELRPDPSHDPVCAVFYCVKNDVPVECSVPDLVTGIIIVQDKTSEKKRTNFLIHDIDVNCDVSFVLDEKSLMEKLVQLVQYWDPDILMGYEVEMLSWGYIFERAFVLEINLCPLISRIPSVKHKNKSKTSLDETTKDQLPEELSLLGRIMLNAWRLMRHEVALQSYTFENVSFHILHERVPLISFKTLTQWWGHRTRNFWGRVADHYLFRVQGLMRILEQLDLINRTSELARIFGIQFYEVLSRGSQFRVESMMLRLAKPLNYIPISPSIQQRARMRAPECLQLIMEPESQFYVDPVIVLDFQSLYPSIIIAYNYCYSSCLGRVEHLGQISPFEFGCSHLKIPPDQIKHNIDNINISPCGVAFVNKSIRKGIMPCMLEEILETRLMVKKSMKEHKENKILQRVLHSRQLGLKLIANVTYGYTAANFSGRMACVEVGDSVVSKGRETLERAIQLVESNPHWDARVVYGDTDSLFVLVPGRNREDAFAIGAQIAETVTQNNPSPVKLKLEKVYQPCILQTKKRYVGYMYENTGQKEPIYDAKGIETVRRDGCPVVAKVLEKSLRLLFETKDVSKVKTYVQRKFSQILEGKISIKDLTFAREYRGFAGYKPGACVPALELTKKWLAVDPRAEPRVNERVPYVVASGAPNVPLIQLVKSPLELVIESGLRVHSHYYVSRVLCPPLARCFSLLGADVLSWYTDLPRRIVLNLPKTLPVQEHRKFTISQYFSTSNCTVCHQICQTGICSDCQRNPQIVAVVLAEKIHEWERYYYNLEKICQSCSQCLDKIECISLDCPVMYHRYQSKHHILQEPFIQNLQEDLRTNMLVKLNY